jgi:hypothetical protein
MPQVPAGFPDYYRFQARSQEVYLFASEVGIATKTYNTLYVGAQESLLLYINANTAAVRFSLAYWMNAAITEFAGSDIFELDNIGHDLNVTIPVRGPYLVLVAEAAAGATNYDIILSATTGMSQSSTTILGAGPILISQNGTSIGAATTTIFTSARVWVGEAHWFGYLENDTSSRITLEAVDYLGNVRILDYRSQALQAVANKIFLPPCRIQIRAFNNAAGPKNFYGAVIGRPLGPGS